MNDLKNLYPKMLVIYWKQVVIGVVSKGTEVSWLLTVEQLDLADRKPLQLLKVFYKKLLVYNK